MGCLNEKQASVFADPQEPNFEPANTVVFKKKSQQQRNSIYVIPPSATIASGQMKHFVDDPQNLFLDLNLSNVFRNYNQQRYTMRCSTSSSFGVNLSTRSYREKQKIFKQTM